MSGIDNMEHALSPSESIDAEAAAWFVEQDEPQERTEQARAEFDAWLSQSPKHLMAYWRAETGWDHAGLLGAVRAPLDLRDGTAIPRTGDRRDWKLWFGRLTAIAAVLFIAVAGAFELTGHATVTYATPVGGSRTITLADGSRVELNTDTILRVITARQDRAVELVQGEAFFAVKHDPAHPLVVTIGSERLVDLGTAFVVRKDAEGTRVGLVEGSVRLEEAGFLFHSPLATLEPGDIAVETADNIVITKGAARELADDLGWRSGRLIFRQTMLADAAAEFNRYNAQKLVVADPQIATLKLSSVFPLHAVEAFARVAQKSLGLHVTHQGRDILLTH